MVTMDLRINQESMAMQNRFSTEYGSHAFKMKENFEETDIKGNNNLFNSLKTEANSNHDHDPSSLFEVKCPNKNNLEVDNSLFSYSSFKKAMDLRTHNRTLEGGKRTIFDDAEYFAKNYCYKLLPITFEQVDETVIQSEHNYFIVSITSESEVEEDCSRTMDYSQIKEKNYKRRRTKFREGNEKEKCKTLGGEGINGIPSLVQSNQNESFTTIIETENATIDNSETIQPLDLSAAPLVQDEKTETSLREHINSISNNVHENDETVQPDSDKENVNSKLNGILVTITRPDEIANYQPCDLFLNDIARLVPWLIDKDCCEIDILDRTCDRSDDEFRKNRLYYVISESTWRLFQKTNERVILTNDQSLGQPLRKAVEKGEKQSYLVFDQFSLAKCLAEYCQEIGGCFEYTCVEEGKTEVCLKKKAENAINIKEEVKVFVEEQVKVEKTTEVTEEKSKDSEELGKVLKKPEEELGKRDETVGKQEESEGNEQTTERAAPESDEMIQNATECSEQESVLQGNENSFAFNSETLTAEKVEIPICSPELDVSVNVEVSSSSSKTIARENVKLFVSSSETVSPRKVKISVPNSKTVTVTSENKSTSAPNFEKKFMPNKKLRKSKQISKSEKTDEKRTQREEISTEETTEDSKESATKLPVKRFTRGRKFSIQPKPKIPRITTRSKSTSESETSQKSDKPVKERGKREGSVLPKVEPPNKLRKPVYTEGTRKTRSGTVLEKVKIEKPIVKKMESAEPKITRKRMRERAEGDEGAKGRCLRSQKVTQEKVTPKAKHKGKR